MAAQFDNLVKNIVANPDQKISDFSWLTETKLRASELAELTDAEADPPLPERTSIMADHATELCGQELREVQMEKSSANTFPRGRPNLSPEQDTIHVRCFHPTGTFVEFSPEEVEKSIPCRFERIVRQYPDRVAVKYKDRRVTYAELNRTANRIAHTILAQRGEREEAVVLLFDHGMDVIAAIMGVLKAGKFFVVLDTQDPIARNLAALKESRAELILTCASNASLVSGFSEANIQVLHTDFLPPDVCSQNPELHIAPSALTYVGYTSGSTGAPKGVMQNHRNLLQQTMVYTNTVHVCVDDRLTLLHSCNNGASTPHLFSALLNGATLFPFNPRTEETESLARWLTQEGITIYHSVSALFRDFTDILTGSEDLSKVRIVHLSGDTVTKKDLHLYQKHFSPDCIFVNRLGSREANTVLLGLYDKSSEISESILPIGPAVEGKDVLLLGDNNEPVGGQSVGEIVIRSHYLSPGYWHNPEQTGAAFECPAKDVDERLYRTGDLGRLLPNGCYQHLGRKDSRVKVRGYRIELAEIEIALLNLAMVKESAVLTWELPNGEIRLIAYVVSDHQPVPTSSELRRLLRETLPDYMIPASIMFLDRLPRNLFGKIDRRAIPAPNNTRPELDTPYAAPRTPTEEQVSRIWTEILCLDEVGIHDNFFDLGGHSLAATRVVSQVIKIFQLEVPLQSLFQAPTVAKMAAVITDYQAQKDIVPAQTIVSRKQDGQTAPLSFAQQRLWFLSRFDPQSPAYNQPKAIRLQGSLDVEILKRSLEAIIARHEVLRTTYSAIDGQPSLAVSYDVSIELPIIDLSGHAETEREAKLQSRIAQLTEQPFDLSRDLPLRAALLKLGPAEFVLLLVTHHIASDGWSSEILQHEIVTLYRALISGEPNLLPELPIQYADYAIWQREWVSGEVLEKQLRYWKTQLSNIPALELSTDRPRRAIQTSRGARLSVDFPRVLSDQLNDLSRNQAVTLFMTLLAAFQTLLQRYSGQDDIAVGSPIAGRTRPGLEGLIGCFINTLVLRTDLSANPTFVELLARVRKVALGAYEYQDMPFEKLVEELHPDRDLSRSPLFQVLFAHQNMPRQASTLSDLTFVPVDVNNETAKFDLSLYTWEEREGLRARLEYNTDLYDAATISRMLGHFETLLEGIVANPEQRIGDLPILSEGERQQVLVEWNDRRRDYPREKCIHELFEAQVEKTPDRVAAVFEEKQLTYRELNTKANQLAHYLQKLGVGPEALVGICMERSLEMIIGLLGILKARGAYVPLDPTYPKERLAFMLQDAQVAVLITQQQLLSELRSGHGAQLLCVDTEWARVAEQAQTNPDNIATRENLAYVIYTSGSTGKPKGVQIAHGAVVNFLSSMQAEPGLTADDTLLAVTTLSFDIAGLELYLPLSVGARVVIVSRETAVDGVVLAENLVKSGATIMQATPTTWRMLLETGWQGSDHLKILSGGEALTPELATELLPRCSSLWNMYGPTETTIWSSIYKVETPNGAILIGRPIGNTQLYILDRNQQPVPIGVPGELYIGGDGLARGYLNRGELTDERFVADRFRPEAGKRLYKTGDLARWRADGNIEIHGRLDHQVKIRGFRIELGEIEAVIKQHPAVRDSVVVVHENDSGDKQLVGYIVPSQEQNPTVPELSDLLNQKLPHYMLPSAFVFLDSLPLTPNGKVNRKALPPPDPSRPELESAFVAPRSPTEELLAKTWAEVLKLEEVGIHDNFFDLGGHSLLATQVISRLREAFRLDLPLRRLFESPTVAGLAERIETLSWAGGRDQPSDSDSSEKREEMKL
jgi:amino acid adenylation domain-containing protein